MRFLIATFILIYSLAASAQQQTIAYWAQNGNALPGGGFGFTPVSFPQPADVGEGFILLRDFNDATAASGAYSFIQSFGGDSANALPAFPPGGSLSPQGGTGNSNNGMSIDIKVDTTDFKNIQVSWAQRGTGTGFNSRRFSWSADGESFTEFATDEGPLGASWQVISYNLSPVADLADNPSVVFRITLDGASNQNGNNRFDNILVVGTEAGGSEPVEFACGNEVTRIHAVQGSGFVSPILGQTVQVEAIVVGEFQSTANGGLGGFYLQEADANQDDDPLTSEGIFVLGNSPAVARGDVVRVAGSVVETFGETRIGGVSNIAVCASGRLTDTSPAVLELPVEHPIEFEAVEGMWVETIQELTVTEVFSAARFGEVQVSKGRLFQPTQVVEPGAPTQALQAANDLNRIIIDDARNGSNRLPFINGGDNETELAADNPIRNGYTIEPGFEGLMSFAFDRYRLHPLAGPTFIVDSNPWPDAPDIVNRGNLRIATYNVENLFTTLSVPGSVCGPNRLGCRGARTASELERQLAKIVAAIQGMEADVLALTEVENDEDNRTLQRLVDEINSVDAIGDWGFLATGYVGTDAIKPAFIYRATRARPEGKFAVLDQDVDPRFDATRQRPALAQTFRAWNSGKFTAVAVHLRAKGSCPAGNPVGNPNADQDDGQGCWNEWRRLSSEALVDWLHTDPTGSRDQDFLILGDFNSYAQEDPMFELEAGGYINLGIRANDGDPALYSFVFFGQAGALDHAMASPTLATQVLDAIYWPINADEIPAFNYREGTLPGGFAEKPDSFYNADPFRSSDHDPLIIELELTPCAPGIVNRPQHPRGKVLPVPRC